LVLCFAARYVAGEPVPNEELAEIRWMDPEEIAGLRTTEGLAEIVAEAVEKLAKA
jgi:NADH pyrophosphatase NudC (nudix superfamily)